MGKTDDGTGVTLGTSSSSSSSSSGTVEGAEVDGLGTTSVVKRVVVTCVVEVESISSADEEGEPAGLVVVGLAASSVVGTGLPGVVVGSGLEPLSVGSGIEPLSVGSTGQTVVEMAMVSVTTVPGQSVTVGAHEVTV